MDKYLVEIMVTCKTLLIVCFSFKTLNALNGRLPVHFVGYEEK